jgi:hypothetical protein
MVEYETKEIASKTVGRSISRTLKITRKDKKANISTSNVKALYEKLEKQAEKDGKAVKIMIRAMAIDGKWTLKGLNTELNVLDRDEYYTDNRVKDSRKFSDFAQLQITIVKSI